MGLRLQGPIGEILSALEEFALAGITIDQRGDNAVMGMSLRTADDFRTVPYDATLPLHGVEIDTVGGPRLGRQFLPAFCLCWNGADHGSEY